MPPTKETSIQQTYQPSPLDTLTPEKRSERMRRVRGRDTKVESRVRNILKSLSLRYRLQYTKLPGKPDFAFPGKRKVIWVHGCFWHRHGRCALARLPKGRREFWVPKLEGNRRRDLDNQRKARELGWKTLVIWECELRAPDLVEQKLRSFLGVK